MTLFFFLEYLFLKNNQVCNLAAFFLRSSYIPGKLHLDEPFGSDDDKWSDDKWHKNHLTNSTGRETSTGIHTIVVLQFEDFLTSCWQF